MENSCCFIGHRKINVDDNFRNKLVDIIEDLIINYDVKRFLFGSKSEFNSLCYDIVNDLKNKYPFIKRIFYSSRSEGCILEEDKEKWIEIYKSKLSDEKLFVFDGEVEFKNKYSSGRANYLERNMAMIDDSKYCIFYYDNEYEPSLRKYSRCSIGYYQPSSGTKKAYLYALRKKKKIINCFIN